MKGVLSIVPFLLGASFRSRLSLPKEILALRHQLAAYQRAGKRPHIIQQTASSGRGYPGSDQVGVMR